LRRDQFLPFFAQLPAAVVVMEACGTCHFWARKLRDLGHTVVLLPPHLVRPFVRRNKTDRADAAALVEAYRNGDIRPVPVKTPEQQVLTSLHRLREGWMAERTARLNALRGLLREQGVFIRMGAGEVVPAVWSLIEDADSELAAMPLRALFAEACEEIRQIEHRLELVERELKALARQMPAVERLMQIPGIGLIIATALVGFVGDLRRFPSARHLASYLGLTPREYSSGLRQRLGRISKRGDAYLRMLLIHGARSVLSRARTVETPDRLRVWALALEKRAHHNKATVALANKIARIAWAISVKQTDYRSLPAAPKVA
jgi:transposase